MKRWEDVKDRVENQDRGLEMDRIKLHKDGNLKMAEW